MSWHQITLVHRALRTVFGNHRYLPLLFQQVFDLSLGDRLLEWSVDIFLIEPFVLNQILLLGVVLIFITLVRSVGA